VKVVEGVWQFTAKQPKSGVMQRPRRSLKRTRKAGRAPKTKRPVLNIPDDYMPHLYTMLDVGFSATEAEITAAFRTKSAQLKPNKRTVEKQKKNIKLSEKEEYDAEHLAWVKLAYNTLSDKVEREAYHKEITERINCPFSSPWKSRRIILQEALEKEATEHYLKPAGSGSGSTASGDGTKAGTVGGSGAKSKQVGKTGYGKDLLVSDSDEDKEVAAVEGSDEDGAQDGERGRGKETLVSDSDPDDAFD